MNEKEKRHGLVPEFYIFFEVCFFSSIAQSQSLAQEMSNTIQIFSLLKYFLSFVMHITDTYLSLLSVSDVLSWEAKKPGSLTVWLKPEALRQPT